ncbi:hypothetical protein D5041_06525 [Verminephrobacter aporrectodeae subsp. tuberculatae]|uniref:hypothetical protein n=1 Tax=Verminephrobacter aporrectodeae TaxID=1110389 RepID=UPI0022377FAF|nr:hypothetical protein [Verminephrobacter aporrectodeae]MCW5223260.1 hypothetical protein [Verminephrobacter aporrectodeae subsp. tuberculatae]MCW5288724.1 hypothetical protein [Verminephrobacter aporrectodeae subsp. tuberculatae]
MTQQWISALIVALAAAYVLWRWMPARLRRWLQRVHPAMAQEAPGCGGGCSRCAGCSTSGAADAAQTPAAAAAQAQPMSMPGQSGRRS